jgi:hypothetical protein
MEYPELVQIKTRKRVLLGDLVTFLTENNKMNLFGDDVQLRNVLNPRNNEATLDVIIIAVLEAILNEMKRETSNVENHPMYARYDTIKREYDDLKRRKKELMDQMYLRLDTRANPQPVPGGKKRKSMKRNHSKKIKKNK